MVGELIEGGNDLRVSYSLRLLPKAVKLAFQRLSV